MSTISLPGSLHQRLERVARRLRWLHVLRRLSLLLLVLSGLAGGALLTDYLLRESLPALARGLLLTAWLALAGVFLVSLLRALFRPLDAADLAAVIEEKYPELGERLTSSVELCQHADAGNGSPALIALLVEETEARTGRLNLPAAISPSSTAWLLGLAVLSLLVTLIPAAFAPGPFARLAQRFFVPWQTLAPSPDFTFTVEPGDTFAARGRPLTIRALLTPREDSLPLPRLVSLVLTGSDGSKRLDMTREADDSSRFAATFRLSEDLHYHVEAGNASSASYQIQAVTPVDLAPDSPALTVTPPGYASAVFEEQSLTGMVDVTALQHSTLRFRFRFHRPAHSATFLWLPNGEKQSVPTLLPLSEDRLSAEFLLPATASGSYRLVLEAEHGVRTEREGGLVTVRPDQPPAALNDLKQGARAARSYDRLPLELRLADDIAVTSAVLEYRLNDNNPSQEEPLSLEGAGTREALARHVFLLAGKVQPGDELHYRIRYTDNFPKEYGGPHVCYYPAEGWNKLRIVAEGGSLKEQDILSRRDQLYRKLDEIKTELKREQRKILQVRGETRDEKTLSPRGLEGIREAIQQNQNVDKASRELSREMAQEPGEEKLAEATREVAQKEMAQAEQGLREASAPNTRPEQRDRRFRDSEDELSRALSKLDRLRQEVDNSTREKLAQAKVEALADRQNQLAEQAAKLQDPTKQPTSKEHTDQLRQEQEAVAQELKRLTESDPTLQKALEEARAEQTRQAADRARQLAQAQRDLAQASEETEKKRERELLADLARQQEQLAQKVDELARQTSQPARANFARPLQPEDASRASQSLKQGDTTKALQEQDRTARELDRLARDLDRAVEQGRDPKVAARQLARLEEELARRSRERLAKREELSSLKPEQQAIRDQAEKLSVPDRPDLLTEKQKANQAIARAEQALAQNNGKQALTELEKAAQSLRELANKMPSLDERKAQARREVEKLKKDQQDVARKVEQAVRSEKSRAENLREAAQKQEEIAKSLQKLDAPARESRRDRAAQAARQAEHDLRQARPAESKASQTQVQRELERLAQSLAGQKLPDEKAAELAKRQQQLAEQAKQPNLSTAKQEELRREQRQIADETRNLEAREAPVPRREAIESTKRAADQAARSNPTSQESRRAMSEAARKLDELARAMGAKPEQSEKGPSALPRKEQADAARQLAQQQRDLREAVQRAGEQMKTERRAAQAPEKENQAAPLAREQSEIARQSTDLAREVAREQGERSSSARQAREASSQATEASRDLQSGALEQARSAGQRSAEQLRQLANELAKTNRASDSKGDTLEQTRRLAQRQEALNKRLDPLAQDRSAQRIQQRDRQEDLSRQTQQLLRELDELGRTGRPTQDQARAREAANSVRNAENSMRAARNQAQQGNQPATQAQRELAARALEQAARSAEKAGRPSGPPSPSQQAGQAMQRAQGEMNQARNDLQQNRPAQASKTMQQAAQGLAQAAQQLAQALQPRSLETPTNSTENGVPEGGVVDAKTLPQELAAHAGKRWGDLPGEVQTRVVQQMKARYGEDYARMIKLYFEQIADTRKKR